MPRDEFKTFEFAANRATDIAIAARSTARWMAAEGRLNNFTRGLIHGQLLAARCMFVVEPYIIQGIDNEVQFILRRAK